ncbi:hypothetical protein [Marinoscillum furvescens]|uniref:Carbohydrate binding protein n=1 Tax=Marinoscillum furvescens DSM 4134 TaxID=1122208 RepID=A0A3D9KZM6_MARFU|nr:hypothetical protein [Marinoscillum furvescens]RED96017.1 hypothetical protein C7460_11675 [Marinoscillum furvescens DSM 4134]
MKNIIKIATLLLAVVFMACEEDYVAPTDFSDVGWYTTEFRKDSALWSAGINGYVSFSDLSVNALEHAWIIPGGAFFLEGTITRKDTVYSDKIVNRGDTVSDEKTIHVLFTEPGQQIVTLRNYFKDSVAFRGLDTVAAVQQPDGRWLYEKQFMVDVYDSIKAEAKIFYKGAEIPLSEDTLVIEAGESIDFVDVSTQGRPNDRGWSVAGKNSADSISTVTFTRLGVYSATLRSSRSGENIPGGSDFLRIPNPIKVIPSSLPFEQIGTITEREDETIVLSFNGEFEDFGGQESFFTVDVEAVGEIAVKKVEKNPADGSQLLLTLSEPIYQNDNITVSYSGGNLTSIDTRSLESFSNEPVEMYQNPNLAGPDSGFEVGGAGGTAGWEPTWDSSGSIEYSTEQAASGSYSLKLSYEAGGNFVSAQSSTTSEFFQLEEGVVYELRFKVFVDPSNDAAALSPWIRSDTPGWFGKQFWTSTGDVTKGEWTELVKEYEHNNSNEDFYFMFRHNSAAGPMYIDDWSIAVKEERP